jgi:Ser/Thr protein kinase RdoA (MazF antagonist)
VGETLEQFWATRKAEVLATLPSEIGAQVSAAMSLHLGAELGRFTALAASNDPATEEHAWTVIRILRAYKATASRLPVSRADAKARLHAVLDAVALSVQRLLPPPLSVF